MDDRQNDVVVRVVLPAHLQTLAKVRGELSVAVEAPVTQHTILSAVERDYPMLRGTIRDHGTLRRRAFVRFFACGDDLSHEDAAASVPAEVARGAEPFIVVGAMAGG